MFDAEDTIAALASAPGAAARAIVRVSGPRALDCAEKCFAPEAGKALSSLCCAMCVPGSVRLRDVAALVPCMLYVWPTSRSYTRQPTVEFHTFGSPPLAEALVNELCVYGARPARPGEFTMRAFLAGRIDLTQAEAVLGVIDASDRQELETALTQLAGGLAIPLSRLRGSLLDVLAHLEAGLDFAEEAIEFISAAELARQLATAQSQAEVLLEQMHARGEAATVTRVVLVGAANVGKSSLYNALTGQGALVSDLAGTTRDYLTARLDIDGVVGELVDTAGSIPVSRGGIELAAQEATAREEQRADIEILCFDATRPLAPDEADRLGQPPPHRRIIVLTKIDQAATAPPIPDAVATSSRTGAGLDRLRLRLREAALEGRSLGGAVAATAVRCRESLRQACRSLALARELALSAAGEELVASELRSALQHLGEVAGAVCTDDLLDRIFSRFCIGK